MRKTALYLAHLNPLTRAHAEIIDSLRSLADSVVVMPVVFMRDGAEVNSRSFPFTYDTRREMIESIFGDTVRVSKTYTFHTPFRQYAPPLFSGASWSLRRSILDDIDGDYFTYTGDRAEWLMLKMYALKPMLAQRKKISATNVREEMYRAVSDDSADWRNGVPEKVVDIITKPANWDVVRRFADSHDTTRRILGMKFPA